MKNKIVIFLLLIFQSGILLSQNSESISNSENLAWDLNNHEIHKFRNQPTQPYIEGKLKIVSGKKNDVVVGIDEDNNGRWDKFIGIQTSEKYELNEDISNGEIIYTPSLIIVNSKDDKRRYILELDNDKSNEVESRIPKIELQKVQKNLVGYGLHVHKGENYKFEDFIN